MSESLEQAAERAIETEKDAEVIEDEKKCNPPKWYNCKRDCKRCPYEAENMIWV
jgi:hypothetical protein